jgi:hypothetical protein
MLGINGDEGSFGMPMDEEQWGHVLHLSESYLGIPEEERALLLALVGATVFRELHTPSMSAADFVMTLLNLTLGTAILRDKLLPVRDEIKGPAFLLIDLTRLRAGEDWVLLRPLADSDLQIIKGSAKMN